MRSECVLFPFRFFVSWAYGVLQFELPLVQMVSDLKCYVCVAHGSFQLVQVVIFFLPLANGLCMFLETIA